MNSGEPPVSTLGRRIRVSASGRHFVTEGGDPFFYLADTAWALFKRLDHDELETYLRNRIEHGFTVIQAYVLRGLQVRNLYGHVPLVDRDPTRLDEGFFDNVDYVVNRANQVGLVMALVTTMGHHVRHANRLEPFRSEEAIFDEANAFAYGALLGRRYRENCVIWLLGGDHDPADVAVIRIWDAMANGLKSGSEGRHLVSYHSSGGHSSSTHFHNRTWLDFNAIQSRHRAGDPNYQLVEVDYGLSPAKPTLDMEARYEDIIGDLFYGNPPAGRIDAHQVREAAYWAVLAGAAGHGYGHNSVFQMHGSRKADPRPDYTFLPIKPRTSWREALDSPGAIGMQHLRKLVELRPWHEMVPDQLLVAGGQGEGEDHVQAARARDGSFAILYLPQGAPVVVAMDRIAAGRVKAQWYDPARGTFDLIGHLANAGTAQFSPPTAGPEADWVLVLEDAQRGYAMG
jgi:hypothetical protein